jgi:hypothetical protein
MRWAFSPSARRFKASLSAVFNLCDRTTLLQRWHSFKKWGGSCGDFEVLALVSLDQRILDLVTDTPLHWVLSYASLYPKITAGSVDGFTVQEE